MKKLQVIDYQPLWKDQFENLKNRIWPEISDHCIAIEHVGGTSVENLAAKPIIDIDIIIESNLKLPVIIKILNKLGYKHRGNFGVNGREVFVCITPDFPHNLYVCLDQCTALKNHLVLRDHFRKNPIDRNRYSKLKKQLAHKYPRDIDSYINGKTDFILSILKKYNFNLKELKTIENINKK